MKPLIMIGDYYHKYVDGLMDIYMIKQQAVFK